MTSKTIRDISLIRTVALREVGLPSDWIIPPDMPKEDAETRRRVQVSYGGGVFNSKFLLRQFKATVKQLSPKAHVVAPLFGPDGGALLLAYRNAGKKISKQLLKNMSYAD